MVGTPEYSGKKQLQIPKAKFSTSSVLPDVFHTYLKLGVDIFGCIYRKHLKDHYSHMLQFQYSMDWVPDGIDFVIGLASSSACG